MTTDPTAMLRQLGQSARINAPSNAQPAGSTGVQSGEFSDLLSRARNGTLSSNKPVTVKADAGLKLSEDQLARLSLAADRAEAAGLRKALVTIDDQRVILDVQQRTVLGNAGTLDGVLDGIDGVIDLSGSLVPPAGKPGPIGPPASLESPAVARLLALQDQRERAA